VLTDHELETLRDIERRLRRQSPELARLSSNVESHPARAHHKRARVRVLVAAVALAGLATLTPRTLNEADVRARRIPPPPRTPPSDTHVTRRLGLVCDAISAITVPDTVVDLFLSSPNQEPEHAYSLSRQA
jgi:hypothetical protein